MEKFTDEKKRFKITYKNSLILFGNNIFTQVLEGRTAKEALVNYGLANDMTGMLTMIDWEEIK